MLTKQTFNYYILPLAGWLALIFAASTMSYESQSLRPLLKELPTGWVERWFSWLTVPYGNSEISLDNRSTEAFLEFFIRKGAHVVVFAVLAILIYRLASRYMKTAVTSFLITMTLVLIIAVIDEYRHFMHPNRSGQIEDVFLDLAGGLAGIAIYAAGRKLIKVDNHE